MTGRVDCNSALPTHARMQLPCAASLFSALLFVAAACLPPPATGDVASSAGNAGTILDELGRLAHQISSSQVDGWRAELRSRPRPDRAAWLHVWLGEVELARNREPEQAAWHFKQARTLGRRSDAVFARAGYDIAIALFYEGAYRAAASAFDRLLKKPASSGTRSCPISRICCTTASGI